MPDLDGTTENPGKIITLIASGAITENRFCKLAAAGKVAQCDSAGEQAACVSRTSAADGGPVSVVFDGDVIVEAGEAIADNALVSTSAAGKAMTADTQNHWILGRVTNGSSAGADVDNVTVRLTQTPQSKVP